MRCVGRRGQKEIKEINGGGIKRRRRQFQERRKHTRRNCTEENKSWYRSMKNAANKEVSKAMREKAE